MVAFDDITGKTFGQLTVIERAVNTKEGRARFVCRCVCGIRKTIAGKVLRNGDTRSCGCLARSILAKRNYRHGGCVGRISPTYEVWRSMWQRCTNSKRKDYQYYGGRGIMVCEEWMRFENFLADMGQRPDGLSLDRINVDGNYEKENCRWVEWGIQVQNKRIR